MTKTTLTPEEWENVRETASPGIAVTFTDYGIYLTDEPVGGSLSVEGIPILMAICNERLRQAGHPNAFSHEHVALLREATLTFRYPDDSCGVDDRGTALLREIADRIAALLPPAE